MEIERQCRCLAEIQVTIIERVQHHSVEKKIRCSVASPDQYGDVARDSIAAGQSGSRSIILIIETTIIINKLTLMITRGYLGKILCKISVAIKRR